jgi:hypothetical protein
MADVERYWFPAKRYGWGWGLPTKWQGWVGLAVYLVLLGVGVRVFPPADSRFSFFGYLCAVTALLFIICYAKGEPPSWRWGDKR